MRLLILTQYYPPEVGAAQLRLEAMARELVGLGHEVEVVTGLPNYPDGDIQPEYRGRVGMTEEKDGIRIRRTWMVPAKGRGLSRIANYGSFAATSLAGLAAAHRPDVIFVESPPPSLAVPAWLAARRWGATLVLNVSDLWPDSAVQLSLTDAPALIRMARRLEAWAYAHADFVTAVTEGIRQTLVETKGVAQERVLFLPNGVDTQLFAPRPPDEDLTRELGLNGRSVVLIAGTLGYAIGTDVALDAAALLGDRPVTFLIAGGGSDRARLEELARDRQLANVQFLGPRPPDEIARLYSVANVAVMTLRDSPLFEGTRPARVLAAMASGVPVVYAGAGEGARMLEQAKAGIVTSPSDARALADAIGHLLDHPEEAQRMGGCGRAYVEANLAWPPLVADWVQQLATRMR